MLIAAKGLAAPEVAEVYARAHELCGEVGDEQLLFAALCGQYSFHSQKGHLATTLATAEEVLRLAERQEDAAPLVIAHRITGTSLLHLGRLLPAREHLERAKALYDHERHATLAARYTFDPLVAGLAFLSWDLWLLGHPEQACRRSRQSIERARELGDPHSLAHALSNACVLHQLRRDRRALEGDVEELIALATEQEFRFWHAIGTILQGWAVAQGRQAEAGIEAMQRGLDDYWDSGATLWSPYFLALLAEVHATADRAADGLALLGDALDRVERTQGRWFEAELHRLKGRLLWSLGDQAAEACLLRALAIAEGQQARSFELRAATSLAQLWREQGRRGEAVELLARLYGGFGEGLDTADLAHARRLLDELA